MPNRIRLLGLLFAFILSTTALASATLPSRVVQCQPGSPICQHCGCARCPVCPLCCINR
ncbi:MAG TPA: hypothetical protein VIA62_03540 [Thermoanaerobaculia bacterium]|jgi:hypothetical protein|nr:hypothetical protein [Thermoanaerobaculia bacterium]